jgi:hypothetical protein
MEIYIKGGFKDKIAFLIILLVFIAGYVVCKIKWWWGRKIEGGKMSRKELKDQLEVFENYINDIPNVIDPCSQCEFKDRSIWDNLEKCRGCCYYYPSNFKIETGKTKL